MKTPIVVVLTFAVSVSIVLNDHAAAQGIQAVEELPPRALQEVYDGEDFLLKISAEATCHDSTAKKIQTITDNLGVNRSGTIHKDEDFVVSYYTSLIGPDYTVATLLSDSKTDKVCTVDYGFPTFVYESLFQTMQYEETIHAAKKHCTVDRRFFETLSTNSNGYKYAGVLDNRDGELFHPDYITFHVYYFHIYEPDMTPAVISYEIYGEFVNPDDVSYYEVCKMATGYKSLLTVANVREFQWGVDWLRIFDDPHWKPKE